MTNGSATIVQKLWNYCNVLRDDGMSYDYYDKQLSQITMKKQTKKAKSPKREGCRLLFHD